MQNTLNDQFISEYCTRFTESVIASITSNNSTVTGKEIINLTPSRQVNFFILKALYGQWQDEMKKLESPFFNYKHEEVRQALTNYMNVLSQHIEVKKEDLKPLLSEAFVQAVYWILRPGDSLKEEIQKKGVKQVSGLKPLIRYFKVYNDDLSYLINEKQDVSIEEFISEWMMLMEQKSTDSTIQKELDALNEVEAISKEQILADQELVEEENTVTEVREEDELKVDEIFAEDSEESISEEEEDITQDHEPEEVIADTSGEEDEEDRSETNSDTDQPGKEDSFDEEEQLVETDDSLNKKFEKNQETLHDQYKEDQVSVAIKHQQKKISSILEAVTVNQEYMFTTELFGGDKEVFLEAVEMIESCNSFDESVELLVSTYSPTYKWDMNSVEVKELLKVVFRRFR